MKFTGEVTYHWWDPGPVWGTEKEVCLTLSHPRGVVVASFPRVTAAELDDLIEDLTRIKEELENAPDLEHGC